MGRFFAVLVLFLVLLSDVQAATYTVTSSAASGSGSFLEALTSANVAGQSHSIVFDATAFDPATTTEAQRTITLNASLPSYVGSGLTLNGDVNGDGVPDVILDGAEAYSGLNSTSASALVIQSMVFRNFRSTAATVPTAIRLGVAGSSLVVRDSVFQGNRNTAAALGGGALIVLHVSNTLEIDRSVFYSNYHGLNGGALYCVATNAVIANSVFYDNQTGGSSTNQGGGAIRYQANAAGGTLNIFNCTIVGNSAPNGSAVGGGIALSSVAGVTVNLHDSIVAGNTGPGGASSDIGITGAGSYTANNVTTGDASGLFVHLGSGASRDLRLASGSPAIDAGGSTTVSPAQTYDLLRNPRLIGGNLDRGAYEYSAARTLDLDADNSSGVSGTAYSTSGAATQNVTVNVADSDAAIGALASDSNVRSVSFVLSGDVDSGETLLLTGSHPNVNAVAFETTTKRLILYSKTNAALSDMQTAVSSVAYRNGAVSPSSGARTVAVTISDASDSVAALTTVALGSDNIPPSISIGSPSLSATTGEAVSYAVTYSDANFSGSTLSSGDITVNSTGTADASSVVVSGSGAIRTVTLSGITGNGTLGISIASGTASDVAGNTAPAAGPSAVFTVDTLVPQISSIRRKTPSAQTVETNAVVFEVTFSEAVSGVDTNWFTVASTNGGTVVATVASVTGGPSVYDVAVDVTDGAGDFRLDVAAPAAWMTSPFADGFNGPFNLAFDAAGFLYVANGDGNSISRVGTNGNVTTFASGFSAPNGIAFDAAGNLYVANWGNDTVSKVTTNGVVSTFATGLNDPIGLAFDAEGNLFVANIGDDVVRKVTTNGTVSVFATGFDNPRGMAFDADGNLYVANYYGGSISKVTTNGVVSSFASSLNYPTDMTLGDDGNLYVIETGGDRVSRVDANGVVEALASGFDLPFGLAIDANGTIFVANYFGNSVTRVAEARIADAAGNLVSGVPYASGELYTYDPNDAPVLGGAPSDLSLTEDVVGDVDLSALTIADADGDALTLTVTASTGTLTAVSGSGVTVGGAGTGVLTLSGMSNGLSVFLQTASNIQFLGATNLAGDSAATLTVVANDGSAGSGSVVVNVDLAPVNDDPFATSVPTLANGTEDSQSHIDLSGMDIVDPDIEGGSATLTLEVQHGRFGLANPAPNHLTATGNGTGTVTLSGALSNILDYLDIPSNYPYTPEENLHGVAADSLAISITDHGNTGAGGGGTVLLGTVTIDIGSVNDDPTDIQLSSRSVGTSTNNANAVVGTLTATDADSGDSHAFSLIGGVGDEDNASFTVSGNTLNVGAVALEAGLYNVRLQTEDGNCGTFEKAFVITVVDDVAPTVTGVTVPGDGTYPLGQNLDFTVSYSEAVTVDGTPQVGLTVGSAARTADYVSGSGTTSLLFRYVVGSGDEDTNGVAVAGTVTANGGTIRDGATNNAVATLNSVGTTTGVLVDGVVPTIVSIARKTPASQAVSTNGVVFEVTFSEAVSHVGTSLFSVVPVNGATVTGTVTGVTGGPLVYDVAVSVSSGTGEFRLDAGLPD